MVWNYIERTPNQKATMSFPDGINAFLVSVKHLVPRCQQHYSRVVMSWYTYQQHSSMNPQRFFCFLSYSFGGNRVINVMERHTGLSKLRPRALITNYQTLLLDVIQKPLLKLSECHRANVYRRGYEELAISSFALTCCTICHENIGRGGLDIRRRIPVSSLTPVRYHLPSTPSCRLSHGSQALTYEAACCTLFEATIPLWGSLITRPAHT